MENLLLLGKSILFDASPVLLHSLPDENWTEIWQPKGGQWYFENGWLHGLERNNRGGILLSKQSFDQDVMLCFTAASVLPATRDLNGLYCAQWDEQADYLRSGYIAGLNGWYDGKSGIESFPENGLNATTPLYRYEPGSEVRICMGSVDGHNFLSVDGTLIAELIDPHPYRTGHVGFSPYCTHFKIRDIEVLKIVWEKRIQSYEPEF